MNDEPSLTSHQSEAKFSFSHLPEGSVRLNQFLLVLLFFARVSKIIRTNSILINRKIPNQYLCEGGIWFPYKFTSGNEKTRRYFIERSFCFGKLSGLARSDKLRKLFWEKASFAYQLREQKSATNHPSMFYPSEEDEPEEILPNSLRCLYKDGIQNS